MHGVCSDDYFINSMKFLKKLSNPTFFVFSDEPDIIKKKKYSMIVIVDMKKLKEVARYVLYVKMQT